MLKRREFLSTAAALENSAIKFQVMQIVLHNSDDSIEITAENSSP